MIRTTQLKGKQLKERLKKLSQPINEGVVSMVEPPKYHNRMKPITSTLKSLEDMDDEEDFDLDEFISELEDEMMMDDILDELGYNVEVNSVEEINFNSKGYKEGRKLVDKLRRKLFRTLNDNELNDFMDVLTNSFGLDKR